MTNDDDRPVEVEAPPSEGSEAAADVPATGSEPEGEPLDRTFWSELRQVRDCVSRELERLRREGAIGSSLAGIAHVYPVSGNSGYQAL